jgi:glucose-6-phosphate isomerase
MKINFHNLNATEGYKTLELLAARKLDLTKLLSRERIKRCSVDAGGGLTYNYGAKLVDDDLLSALEALTQEQQLHEKFRALAEGERMNTGENRMVLHHLCRGRLGNRVEEGGKDLAEFYREQKDRFFNFADRVHKGEITGSTGKRFKAVVQIGIGGSDLGPRALYLALKNFAVRTNNHFMNAFFISNVDPDDPLDILDSVDLESTLFILVSKSGTTQETLTNREFVIEKMKRAGIPGLDPEKHMVAVTSESSPLANSPDFLDAFFIDDFIGGRYSSTSAVGGVVLSLAFGKTSFSELLAGAHEADTLAFKEPFLSNAAMVDACIGVYERNFLKLPVTAILPYSQALHRFPAHLQQLDMESNGKRVNRFGKEIDYSTGPIVFGEPGTNGQHSFFQLLHQGTDIVPLQFIGFRENQLGEDLEIGGTKSQTKLNANLASQIVAFAKGQEEEDKNKHFPGGRPSSLLYAPLLTPKALGALLAHYENKIMFQGFLWNINSFDQEGVQLGKVLTKQLLSGKAEDPALNTYMDLL